jgi:Ca-activated chloride channel family protein
VKQEGVDIVVAIDVSQSMLAEDIKPNRLERARRKVRDLIRMLEGDRIGLVAFAGTAFPQCPLTLDYSAVEIFLDIIDTDLIPMPGTAIGQAIRASVKAFGGESKASRAVILVTDGEDHEGNALEAAQFARDQGVKIFVIGVGQDLGAPIPRPGEGGGFKQDEKGEVVLSKLDESTLEKIALETGGAYVRSVTGDMDLSKIYLENIKQRIEKKELKTTRRKLWREKFQWFALLALLCLIGELIVDERSARTAKST